MIKHNGKQPQHKIPDKSQQQREAAEAFARTKAERALTPIEQPVVEQQPVESSEPSLEQRLADIDRRSRERATDEKRLLAQHYVNEARGKFRRAVSNTTDMAVKSAYEELQRLEKLTGDGAVPATGGGMSSGSGDREVVHRRERRSPEALRADAEKLVEFLRQNGPSKSGDVIRATGIVVKLPLNLRTFVEKYLPGAKVKADGQRAMTTYSVE